MPWHLLRSYAALCCPLFLALACGSDDGQDGGDVDSGQQTSSTGPMTTATTSPSTTTNDSGSASSAGSGTAATSAAESTTGPDEPFACGPELTCNPGEICVLPCCGGPAPGCSPLPEGGTCEGGTLDEGGVRCCQNQPDPVACMQMQWCIPGPCVPDPIRCVPADLVMCTDSQCTTDGCYGDLNDGLLECSCK